MKIKGIMMIIWCVSAVFMYSEEEATTGKNLIKNPGFEEVTLVNTTQRWAFKELLARMVEVEEGDMVEMPAGWEPNPSDGWYKGSASALKYVKGTPGKEVHSGERALFISTKTYAAVMDGKYTVHREKIPGEPGVLLKEPNRFSLYAKGNGTLKVYVYTYLPATMPQKYNLRKVTPEEFMLTDEWKKYEGTIEFTDDEIIECIFVIGVEKGEATVDDVAFYGQ